MVKTLGSETLTGYILCTLGTVTAPPASALDRRLELTNNTHMAIIEIYAAQARTERWQKDLLGEDILPPANSAIVEIDDGAGCQFDLKAIFDDGTTVISDRLQDSRSRGPQAVVLVARSARPRKSEEKTDGPDSDSAIWLAPLRKENDPKTLASGINPGAGFISPAASLYLRGFFSGLVERVSLPFLLGIA